MESICSSCCKNKSTPYRGRDGERICQACYKRQRREDRGLKRPGPPPDPSRPRSRHNADRDTASPRPTATETHCVHDHEFTPENTYVYPSGPNEGRKVCKICRRNAMQRYHGRPMSGDAPVGPWNKNKTHCAAGHEYNEVNTYVKANGGRGCRICTRDHRIRKTYGLSPEQFDALWSAQSGSCAICDVVFAEPLSKEEPKPHVDHDHETGAVRELLCTTCNNILGRAQDDPQRLRAAADYLEKHRG